MMKYCYGPKQKETQSTLDKAKLSILQQQQNRNRTVNPFDAFVVSTLLLQERLS